MVRCECCIGCEKCWKYPIIFLVKISVILFFEIYLCELFLLVRNGFIFLKSL